MTNKRSIGLIAAGIMAVSILGIYGFVGNQMESPVKNNEDKDNSQQVAQEKDTQSAIQQPQNPQDSGGDSGDDSPTEQIKRVCGTEESAKSTTYVTEYKIPTSCSQPRAITVTDSGEVWFAKTVTGSLVKFDPLSEEFTEYDNPMWPKGHRSQIQGLAYSDKTNSLFFTDEVHDSIWKLSLETNDYASFKFPETRNPENKTQMTYPQKIILVEDTENMDGTGATMIVNDLLGGKVTVFENIHSGKPSYTNYESDFFSKGVTTKPIFDKEGNIWYTTWEYRAGGGKLVKLNLETSKHQTFDLPEDVFAPNGMSMDSQGNIWITDGGSSKFLKFDPSSGEFTKYTTNSPRVQSYGNSTGMIRTPISRPYWNGIDDKGRIWFNEQAANAMAMFDPAEKKLVEYSIPSTNPYWADCDKDDPDCGIAQALEMAVGNDKVWFTEWVENSIGSVDPSVPLPFDIVTDPKEITFDSKKDEYNPKTIVVEILPKFDKQSKELDIVTESTFPYQVAQISSIKVKSNNSDDESLDTESPLQSTDDNTILVYGNDQEDNSKTTLELTLQLSEKAEKGTYHIAIGARDSEVTVSRFIEIIVK